VGIPKRAEGGREPALSEAEGNLLLDFVHLHDANHPVILSAAGHWRSQWLAKSKDPYAPYNLPTASGSSPSALEAS
jgi:hypothetical protein